MGSKRIAVIGAGVSGLASVKSCLEEGLEPVAFEKDHGLGGLWYYTPEEDGKRSCANDKLVMLTTRLTNIFSDFPNTERHQPLYVGHNEHAKYINDYVDHFNLRKHIKFGAEVKRVENAEVTEKKWRVTWRESGEMEDKTDYFDGVMVCTGFLNEPHVANIPGLKDFKGPIIHTAHVRTSDQFKQKRVVIIGIGISGCELACQLGGKASEVYLSSRSGTWLLSRLYPFNLTFEQVLGGPLVQTFVPTSLHMSLFKWYSRMFVDSAYLGINPKKPFCVDLPTPCDEFRTNLAFGKFKLRPNVTRIGPTGVHFEDGSQQDVDAIVLATGYDISLPFLDQNLLPYSKDGLPSCYKYMFPTTPSNEGLCFVGLIRIPGPNIMMNEFQARACAAVLAGRLKNPNQKVMERWVRTNSAGVDVDVAASGRNCLFPVISWLETQDDLASFLGVKPNPWRTLLRDFQLGKALLFNIPIASAFRLNGPHKWSGARQAVIQAGDDFKMALSPLPGGKSDLGVAVWKMVKWFLFFVVGGIVLILLLAVLLAKYVFN